MDLNRGLYGSSVLPPFVEINGKQVQLGEVVRGAFQASKLSVKDWNLLDEEQRERKLEKQLKQMQSTL